MDLQSFNTSDDDNATREEPPTLAEMFREGVPTEYLVLLILAFIICIAVIGLFIHFMNKHRTFSTRFTMQCNSTLGIAMTFPVYTTMYFSGMLVPRGMHQLEFVSEAYEALSMAFFLRLILTYLGGKKQTAAKLSHVKLNSPPLCCLTFLPHIIFTRKVLYFHELLIVQHIVLQLVLGFIDLLLCMDGSHTRTAAMIEETYAHYFTIVSLVSLLVAIYGLGGIYHSAEGALSHMQIITKFLLYKVYVTVVTLEIKIVLPLAMQLLNKYEIDLSHGAFYTELRVLMWIYFLVVLQAGVIFPFLFKAYPISDYPDPTKEAAAQHTADISPEEGITAGEGAAAARPEGQSAANCTVVVHTEKTSLRKSSQAEGNPTMSKYMTL